MKNHVLWKAVSDESPAFVFVELVENVVPVTSECFRILRLEYCGRRVLNVADVGVLRVRSQKRGKSSLPS